MDAGHRDEEDRLGMPTGAATRSTATTMPPHELQPYTHHAHDQRNPPNRALSHLHTHGELPTELHADYSHDRLDTPDELHHNARTTHQHPSPLDGRFNAYADPSPYFNSADPTSLVEYTNSGGASRHAHAEVTADDDFYRGFQGACYDQQSSETDYMATSSTSASRARELSSLRSNANGTTPRHPVVPSALGVHRPSTRSVSAPIDQVASRINSTSRQSSVKDLTRRFDDKASTAIPRPPVRTGIPTRQNRSATSGDRPSPTTNGNNTQTSYAALRTSVDRNLPSDLTRSGPGTRGTQRPRFFAEDQMSNNSQSFASRIGKPRNVVSADARAPRSSSNLSPKIAPAPPLVTQPNASAPQGLLFGEILPDHRGSHMVGHGIEGSGARPRRTSESNARPARLVMHQRTLSDPEMLEPSSPSDWYRVDNPLPSKPLFQPLHLDDAPVSDNLLRQLPATTSITRKPQPGAKDRIHTVSTSSKLPLSVRKLASPTPSTSTSSPSGENSRANSPSDPKRQTGIPRNITITSNRAKTPTRRAPSRGTATPGDSTRLNAYVATPPAGLSPSLRSSRPRQSVASATTASSRSRMAGRTRSPASRGTSRAPEPTRRRKISVGPVDFEQRREHIRLAYSKSIRDNQARTARREAAEKRKKELETASRAKAAALAAAQANGDPTPPEAIPLQEQQPDAKAQEPLRVLTTHQPSPKLVTSPATAKDSPTLGIPGSFPAATPPVDMDEPPLSAVSIATEATEFDTEPQTLPGFPAGSDQEPTGLGVTMSGSIVDYQDLEPLPPPPLGNDPVSDEGALHMSNLEEEHLAGEGDRVSIKISLDESLPVQSEQPASELVAAQEPAHTTVLGTDTEEYEPTPYASPSLETTVRILRRESDQEMTNERSSLSPSMYDYEEPEYQVKLDKNAARAIRKFARPDEALPDNYRAIPAESHDQFHDYERGTSNVTERPHRFSAGDSDILDNIQHESYASQQQPSDTSHSLSVPTLPAPANRYSQQSTWTDFSLDSAANSESETRAADYRQGPLHPPNPPFASDSRYSFTPSGSSSARQSEHFSADMSPLDTGDGTFSASGHELQLPELDTGAGFYVPYISRRASRLGIQDPPDIPYPDYEPPPLPTAYNGSISESHRPPSSAYQPGTRPGSTLVGSRRESEDSPPNTSTPHSIDHMSLEAREASLGGQTSVDSDQKSLQTAEAVVDGEVLDKKERHRLQQRRNVIRELVDTEMVFVRDMNIVEEIYKGTAEACPRLDDKTVKLVFRNVDDIVALHTTFCAQLKEAVTSVYMPQGRREESIQSDSAGSNALPQNHDPDDSKDRSVLIGHLFQQNMDAMKSAHEGFLRNSDHAAKRLIQIQQDPTVKVWLNECHEVAKDLTAAWDLDSLLIKPMQRITKYPNLIITLLQHTPPDHPDRSNLMSAKEALETAIIDINKTKKNFELVGQIVGRKRKESDVKAGFARAFGKRVDKLQASNARAPEDAVYTKLHEKFGDDYLRLQVVLRDVEFYTRQISAYVHEFLKYLSSMELVMRLQPGSYPELESKWVQFNVSMRDIEKVALDQHLAQVRKHVIEPFEHVIKAYGNPSLAMKKRAKRRLDSERAEQLKRAGKSMDPKLKELVEQYDALNETLKKELPQLSALTEKIGVICLGNFVNIQASWWSMWKDKVRFVLGESVQTPEVADIVSTFQGDFKYAQEQVMAIGLLNPAYKGRTSLSTSTTRASTDDGSVRVRRRPPELSSPRDRGRSINSEQAPVLPTPDFTKRHSGQFTASPSTTLPSPHQYYYRDYYLGYNGSRASGPSGTQTPATGDQSPVSRTAPGLPRPSTGTSFDSGVLPRQSTESSFQTGRDSVSTFNSGYPSAEPSNYSGLFQSALPMPDGEERSRVSRASSRERGISEIHGYNVLWLAASLFEFNIETTKHEAGYAYLTYQAGEIFDVVAEKGELWLAKNQDDPQEQIGWIWSKHFAKLADS